MTAGGVLGALAVAALPASAVTPYPAAFFAAAQPNTALEMVRLLPGFTLDTGGQVRGFVGAAGNVLIDGARPASKDDGLEEVLKRIPAMSVLRIDVIRGGAPGVDMQGKSVIANIVRKADKGGKLTVTLASTGFDNGDATGSFRAEGSARVGKTTWEGSLLAGKGYDENTGAGPRRVITSQGITTLNALETSDSVGENYKATGAMETPVLGGNLRLNATVFINPYRYYQSDKIASPPGWSLEHDHSTQASAEIGLRYDYRLGARANVESFLIQQFGQSRYVADFTGPADAEAFSLGKQTSETIARTTVSLQPSASLAIQTGAEGDFNWMLDHTRYVANGVPTSLPAANVRITELRGETFGTLTWEATKSVTVEAGLRGEVSRIASTGDVGGGRSFAFAKPRLSATWSPDGADQFRVRIEREVGQLDFEDFAASASLTNGAVRAGNPGLTPEQAWVYEVAYDRKFWSGGQITATYRHFDLTDVVDRAPVFDPSGVYDAPGNIGSGVKSEVTLLLTLPTGRLGLKNGTLTARQTFRWSRVNDPTTGLARAISGLHPEGSELHFTQGLPKLNARWGVDLYGQTRETFYRFNEIDTDKLKIYAVLFVEYKPRPDLVFHFEVENLGGRAYRHVRVVYGGPRDTSPLSYTDIRDLHGPRGFYIRMRKSFG